MCEKRKGRGGGGPVRGWQGLALQGIKLDRAGTRPAQKAPVKGGQGPRHSHTVAGPSLCERPPKEGGTEVVARDTNRASALETDHTLPVGQPGALAKADRDRERSAGAEGGS